MNYGLNTRTVAALCGLGLFISATAMAQGGQSMSSSLGLYVYPADNQSTETQAKDDYECFGWAKGQTGHDPMNPKPIYVEAAPTQTGRDGAALRGAARGAIIGEVADDDAGKGAAYGAAVGAIRGRKARQQQQQQSQADAQQRSHQLEQQREMEFKNAVSACLSARGYSVR